MESDRKRNEKVPEHQIQIESQTLRPEVRTNNCIVGIKAVGIGDMPIGGQILSEPTIARTQVIWKRAKRR